MESISKQFELYCYISTQAAYDPVKTIYVCAPDVDAASYDAAERFAERAGWKALAEADGAVLVLPVVKNGWAAESPTLLAEIYQDTKASFPSQSGKSLYGRDGFLWCWETLLYVVGYEQGATFAGNAAVACPNHFTAVALINGAPTDYAAGDAASDHWLVKSVSADYNVANRDIPVCLWMLTNNEQGTEDAVRYFSKSNGVDRRHNQQFGGIPATVYDNAQHTAQQIRVSGGRFDATPQLSETILHTFFAQVIRWKNGPDGKLAAFKSKQAFYACPRFVQDAVTVNGNRYPFFVHLPSGMDKAAVAGLPLVFSVHGRGEPAWMFAEKNGWDALADETQAFVLIVPDSPENIWFAERDGAAFGAMIDRMVQTYAIDRTRVYLTGFSNGAAMTRQIGTKYPWLFAGLSLWNAPMMMPTEPGFTESGYEMPCFIYLGDNDPITQADDGSLLREMRAVNGCPAQGHPDAVYTGQNHYTVQAGYTDGDRFDAQIYHDANGVPRVACTIMKNMPHGVVLDESRAAWELLKPYRRVSGAKAVTICKGDTDD